MAERRKAGGRSSAKQPGEVSIEGAGLFLVAATLIAALVGAFFLGRWYERRQLPPLDGGLPAAERSNEPRAAADQPPADVDASTDFFDDLSGEEKQLEPARQVDRAPQPAPAEKPVVRSEPPKQAQADAAPSRPAGGAGYWVQVFAGRDRTAAQRLIRQLEGEGSAVRLFEVAEPNGTLFKVRVGAFDSAESAGSEATRLRARGYSGAWVTRGDRSATD